MIFILSKFIPNHKNRIISNRWWSHIKSVASIDFDTKTIDIVLSTLGSSDENFRSALDKFIKLSIKIANDSDEMRDELALYGDMIFHVYLPDMDYNLWIKTRDKQLKYNTHLYEVIPKNARAIHYILNRKTMTKIIKQQMTAAEAYFKGLITIDGKMSDAIISRNILNTFFSYINYFMK